MQAVTKLSSFFSLTSHTHRVCETRALRTHNTLMPRFTDFFTDLEKNRLFCSLPKGLESGQISRLLKISPRVNTKLIPSFEYVTLSDACLTQYLLFLFVSDLTEEEVLQMAVQLSLQEM